MKKIIDRFGILAFISVAIVFLLSCLVLLGWQYLDSPIKNLFPGQLLSNPVTAICFLISAISFGLINHKKKTVRKVGKAVALLVVLIAAVKFSETLFPIKTGIDSWLFSTKLALNKFNGQPNFLAPNTAIAFIILGFALALSRYKIKRKNVLADYFAMAVTLIAAISIIAYLYEAMEFYHARKSAPMSFPTAVCFLFMSLAVLFRRSEFGFFSLFTTKYQGSKTARYLVPFAILIPVATGMLRLYGEQSGTLTPALGIAMFAVANIVLFLFVIWLSVLSINKSSK